MTEQTVDTPVVHVKPDAPEDHIVVAGKELFMSFALLDKIDKLIQGPEGVANLLMHPPVQREVLQEVFTTYDSEGKPTPPPEGLLRSLSPKQTQEVMKWVGAHVLDFFTQGLQTANNLGRSYNPIIKENSTPTPSGSAT